MIEPNYTEDQTRELVARYQSGETVEQIAEILGKSVRSVVAKLSREGVYKAKTKTTPRTTKMMVIEAIVDQVGGDLEVLKDLEKCQRVTLDHLLTAVSKG